MKKSKLKKKLKKMKQKIETVMWIQENHAAVLRSMMITSTQDTIKDLESSYTDERT